MGSFTDQRPRVVTEEDLKAPWAGVGRDAFRCYLCGHRFELGDYWRWVYSPKYLNFLVCEKCDGQDVQEHWAKHVERGKQEYWWTFRKLGQTERRLMADMACRGIPDEALMALTREGLDVFLQRATKAVEEMLELTYDSEGVAGWHRNGDLAGWDELDCVLAMEDLREAYPKVFELFREEGQA